MIFPAEPDVPEPFWPRDVEHTACGVKAVRMLLQSAFFPEPVPALILSDPKNENKRKYA